jgi:hypothetical protein
MKKILLVIFLLISSVCVGQDFPDGMVVVEFNASFNAKNKVEWLSKLSDCKTERVDITSDSRWASEYKIVVVPTLIVLNNNEEVKRFQANIMMTMEATKKEVQDAIDEMGERR